MVLENSVRSYAVLYIDYGADDLSFYDFIIVNTIGEAAGNQNALRTYANRLAMYNCKIVEFGDTAWFAVGSAYLYNTWIEGSTYD